MLIVKNAWFLIFFLLFNAQIGYANSCKESSVVSKKSEFSQRKKPSFSSLEIVNWIKNINRKKDPIFPFDKMTPENSEQAADILLNESLVAIEAIADSPEKPTFSNLVVKIENALKNYGTFQSIFSAVSSTKTAEFSEVGQKIGKMGSEFHEKFTNNKKLQEKVSVLLKNMEGKELSFEVKQMLKGYKEAFTKLSDEKEMRMIEIGDRLRKLTKQFTINLMDYQENAIIEFKLEELKGLSPDRLARAKELAEASDGSNYFFKTDIDTVIAFLTSVESSETRKKYHKFLSMEGMGEKDTDNPQLIQEMLQLKEEAAKIKGFESYAEMSIKDKAAPSVQEVKSFLEQLSEIYFYNAKKEMDQLRDFKEELTGSRELKPWDVTYWREKLQEKLTGASDQQLMPYFEFYAFQKKFHEKMEQIYGVEIRERSDLGAINRDGQVFELFKDGKLSGYFVTDIFARDGKDGGAWMSQARSGYRDKNGVRKIPTAIINLNIKKVPGSPEANIMLPHESITYAHEFGHMLHVLLSDTRFMDQFGANVAWDVVEVPSQFNENFVLNREFIKSFAFHHETGKAIPEEYIDSFLKSNQFFAGFYGLHQVKQSMIDMEIYSRKAETLTDLEAFEKEFLGRFKLIDSTESTGSSLYSFSHIFAGGYSAGYYSYKWAEVIEADAYSVFQKEGITNPETAKRWIENVLSIGGSKNFDEGVEKFLGRKMDPSALIERSDLELPK